MTNLFSNIIKFLRHIAVSFQGKTMSYKVEDIYGKSHEIEISDVISIALIPPNSAIIKLNDETTVVATITYEFLNLLDEFKKRLELNVN